MQSTFQVDNIPVELKELNRWVNWKSIGNKKPPVDAYGNIYDGDLQLISFTEAVDRAKRLNLGIGFAPGNGVILLDPDNCFTPQGGLKPGAVDLLDRFQSYAEYSPSGKGLRIVLFGNLPGVTKRKLHYKDIIVEVFADGRVFCTITGKIFNNVKHVLDCNGSLTDWYAKNAAQQEPAARVSDEALMHRLAIQRLNSAKITNHQLVQLWEGDLTHYKNDRSVAVLALVKDLLRLYANVDTALEVFRQSPLYNSDPKYARTLEKYDLPNALKQLGIEVDQFSVETGIRYLTEAQLDQLADPVFLFGREIVKGELNLIYGQSGSGKTFVALDYAMRALEFGAVMYVATEDVSGLKIRKQAWRKAHNSTGGEFFVWGEELNLLNGDVEVFIQQVQGLGLGLIVFDTLAMCMIGYDENSGKDMGLVVRNLQRIQKATGATIIVVHHTDKHGLAERGHSALRGASYSMIEIKAKEDSLIEVVSRKAKNTALFDTICFRLEDRVLYRVGLAINFDTASSNETVILDYLHVHKSATFSVLRNLLGVHKMVLTRVLNGLRDQGKIYQLRERGPWQLVRSDDGN